MNMHDNKPLLAAALATLLSGNLPAFAQDPIQNKCVEWKKLNLNAQQTQQISQLDNDWQAKYSRMQPQITDLQKKLEQLLPNPKSDPLEIMSTQQTLARYRESLRNEATTNYLRKRALLNETQQHQVEGMVQQMVLDRQRANSPVQTEQSPGLMNIVNKIKWAIEPH